MGSDLYFFEQIDTRKLPRRYRKLPEELPESLRFAHLNPKVAALLASKERSQRPDNEDPFGDGLGKKSLLPDINAAFTNVRNQFDSNMSNDEDSQRYLFEEAKMSAPTILEQLSRIIYYYEDLFKHVPKSLEYQLMSGWSDLTSDVTIVPREWQTHDMKEQYAAKQQQEGNSEEDMSDNDMLTGRSKSRMGTSDRSTSELGSKLNMKKAKPRLGVIEGVDEGDLIPKPDSRLGRRSESRASATGSVIRQHLDIGSMSRMGNRRKGSSVSSHRSISGMSPMFLKNRTKDDMFSMIAETPPIESRSTALANNPLSYMQTINFQLSNKSFEDKGWIMLKGRQEEIDQNEILEYCVTRMQESMKQIAAQRQKDTEQGHDNPIIVRYYGDTKKETLLKYRKSPVKATPSPVQGIHKGGKPRIPSIIDERNEGKKLMQASHQDGSTVIYYPSGRPAIIHSAAGFGRPGFYTVVYEDGLDSKMLACFTPCGKGVCYHENGVVRFLATDKGGHLSESNGKLIRKWKWPQASVKITEPLSFQLSSHVLFRCVSQGQMTVVFSCQKEMARFTVGPNQDAEDYKFIDEADQLLTTFTFSSKAAKDLMRIFAPTKKSKRKGRKNKKKKKTEQEPSPTPPSFNLGLVQHVKKLSEMPASTAEAPVSTPPAVSLTELVKTLITANRDRINAKHTHTFYEQTVSHPNKQIDQVKKTGMKTTPRPLKKCTIDSDEKKNKIAKPADEINVKKGPNIGKALLAEIPEQTASQSMEQVDQVKKTGMKTTPRLLKSCTIDSDEKKNKIAKPANEINVKKGPYIGKGLLAKIPEQTVSHPNEQIDKVKKTGMKTTPMPIKKCTIDLDENLEQDDHVKKTGIKTTPRPRSVENIQNDKVFNQSVTPDDTIASHSKPAESAKQKVMKTDIDSPRSSSSLDRPRNNLDEETEKRVKSAKPHAAVNSKASSPHMADRKSKSSGLSKTAQALVDRLSMPKQNAQDNEHHSETSFLDPCKSGQGRLLDSNTSIKATYVESSSRRHSDVTNQSLLLKSIMKRPTSHSKLAEGLKSSKSGSSEETFRRAQSASPYMSKNQKQADERPIKSATSHTKHPLLQTEPIDSDEKAESQHKIPVAVQGSKSFVLPMIVVEDVTGEMSNISVVSRESEAQQSVSCRSVLDSSTDVRPSSSHKVTFKEAITLDSNKSELTQSGTSQKPSCSSFKEGITPDSSKSELTQSGTSQKPSRLSFKEGITPDPIESKLTQSGTSQKPPCSFSQRLNDSTSHDDHETDQAEFEKQGQQSIKRARRSTIMHSILQFRRKVMAKKGMLSEEESSEDDSDSSGSTTSKSTTSDVLKLLENFPDKVTYDIEADKELAKLQRKAKNLIDDWMEHYRIAVGLSSPYLQNVREGPNYSIATRYAKSARLSDHQQLIRKAILGIDDDISPHKARVPSAPLGTMQDGDNEDGRTTATERVATTVTFEDHDEAAGDGCMSPTAMALLNRLTETASRRSTRSKSSSARSGSPSRQYPAADRVPSASGSSSRSHCPLVIRQYKLGYERPQCRCSTHHIPFIMDLELDDFVATETPEGQLIVIMIVSSLFPGITKAEEMLNELYGNQNRNRTRPCVQSRSDMFRVFKYDINTAAEMSDHTQPLLLTRHSVVPGMFLIYCDGKLLFCDHIFNGYGNTRKDFKKQVMKSRHDSIQGFSLPKDFKFSPSQGKSGMRSAWGGEIGGAGVDKYSSTGTVIDVSLQPIHRPISSSTDSGFNKQIHVDTVNKDVVDLGPFHREIQVRLTPLVSGRGPNKRLEEAVRLEEATRLISMTLCTTGYQPAFRASYPQLSPTPHPLQPV